MALRPGKCYRSNDRRAYTRKSQKKPKKSYVKGVPGIKIRQFETGNPKKNFSVRMCIIARESVQIRDNALEAARISANKYLFKNLGKDNYFLKILIYPHHILRENPIATGAGADRFQEGMRKSFGRIIGSAAKLNKSQEIAVVKVPEGKIDIAKTALERIKHKIPGSYEIKGL